VLSNDSIYYPGVFDACVIAAHNKLSVIIIFNNYITVPGRGEYYDNNGSYLIEGFGEGQTVYSFPANNGPGYSHPNLGWPLEGTALPKQYQTSVTVNGNTYRAVVH